MVRKAHLTKLTKTLSIEQSPHKPMGMFGGDGIALLTHFYRLGEDDLSGPPVTMVLIILEWLKGKNVPSSARLDATLKQRV